MIFYRSTINYLEKLPTGISSGEAWIHPGSAEKSAFLYLRVSLVGIIFIKNQAGSHKTQRLPSLKALEVLWGDGAPSKMTGRVRVAFEILNCN